MGRSSDGENCEVVRRGWGWWRCGSLGACGPIVLADFLSSGGKIRHRKVRSLGSGAMTRERVEDVRRRPQKGNPRLEIKKKAPLRVRTGGGEREGGGMASTISWVGKR